MAYHSRPISKIFKNETSYQECHLTISNADEDGSSRNCHSFAGGMRDSTVTLEDSLVISYKTEDRLVTQPRTHAP